MDAFKVRFLCARGRRTLIADIVSPEKRSQNMSAIRSKNTKLSQSRKKSSDRITPTVKPLETCVSQQNHDTFLQQKKKRLLHRLMRQMARRSVRQPLLL